MSNIQCAVVEFHTQKLTVITDQKGEHWVAMKPICENIGLQWEAQYKRIKRHPVLSEGMSIMNIPSLGGEQETLCLPLKLLNGWLFGVEASRVKPEIRDKLLTYQRECFDVLAAYWQQGAALNPRAAESGTGASVLRFRYNDRPFRCVVEGAQLWFVTADVGNALYLGNASHINPFLTPEQRGHRWVGRQRLNVMSKSGLERAMVQAELKWTLSFRRWLDGVLDQISGKSSAAPAKAIGLSNEQQSLLRDLVKNRIQALPQQQQGKAAQKCWAALKSSFNTPNYKAIAPEQFSEAVSLIARLPLEGELLPAVKALDLHYPISDWQAKSPELFRQDDPKSPDLLVNFHDLGKSPYSPCLELLDKLAEAGYCIDGAFYEFRSYQNQKFHADSMLHTLSYNVRRLLDDVERRRGYPQEYPKVK